MDELSVPKQRTQVDVALLGGTTYRIAVFLAPFAGNHPGPECVSDLLNESTAFIPAVAIETEAVTILNRDAIAVAYVAPDVERIGTDAEAGTMREEWVELTLVDNSKLSGLVRYAPRPGRARVIDFLNDAPRFVPILVGNRIALVNARCVAKVELGSRPATGRS